MNIHNYQNLEGDKNGGKIPNGVKIMNQKSDDLSVFNRMLYCCLANAKNARFSVFMVFKFCNIYCRRRITSWGPNTFTCAWFGTVTVILKTLVVLCYTMWFVICTCMLFILQTAVQCILTFQRLDKIVSISVVVKVMNSVTQIQALVLVIVICTGLEKPVSIVSIHIWAIHML